MLERQGGPVRQTRELRALLTLIDPGSFVVQSQFAVGTLAGVSPPQSSTAIPSVMQGALDDLAAGGGARDFAALEIFLMEGLGVQMPQAVWGALLDVDELPGGRAPPLAMMRQLERASQDGRRGETVLLALAVLKEAGPAGTHPQSLGEIVAALGRVGLERDARRLSVEALMARMRRGG